MQWTYGYADFNQNWTKILWIGEKLEEAVKQLGRAANEWKDSDGYTLDFVDSREYRLYAGSEKLEHELRGKVYIEGPFRVAQKWFETRKVGGQF